MRKLIIDDYHFVVSEEDKKFIDNYTSEEMFKISSIVLKQILGIDIKWKFDCEKCKTTIYIK